MKILVLRITSKDYDTGVISFKTNRVYRIYKNLVPMGDTCTYVRTGDNLVENEYLENELRFDYQGAFGDEAATKDAIIKEIEDRNYICEVVSFEEKV